MEENLDIKLYSSVDEYEILQMCALLEENNIPFVRNDIGTGSTLNLYMGNSIQEKIIYVNKNDYDKALEIISILTSETEEKTEKDDEIQVDNSGKKYTIIRRAWGYLIFGFVALIIIIMIIGS